MGMVNKIYFKICYTVDATMDPSKNKTLFQS